jgi:SAM-dependent methyltransferase
MSSVLDEHLGYLADTARLELFKSAVSSVIRPKDRVVDVGCGSAVLGLMCLRAGASHVDAMDSTAAIEIARKSVEQAGFSSQVNLIHGNSFQVDLTEHADVVICDHVGYFGFDYGLIEILADARHRFLKPGGRMIPGLLKLQLGAVESDRCRALAEGWQAPGIPAEFHWVREHAVNTKYAVNLKRGEIIADPAELGCIDLQEENPAFFSWSTKLEIQRDGFLHGLAGWFECELTQGVWMTNSPVSDRAIDRAQAFLPISEALPVKSGDVIDVTIMTRPSDYLIAWEVCHPASGKKFTHSTWRGDLLMSNQLTRSLPHHVPQLSRAALAQMAVLRYCDGKQSVQQIERAVLRDHPELFPSNKEISRFVASVLGRYTE